MMMIVMKKVRFKQPHIATELIKYFSEEYGGVNFSNAVNAVNAVNPVNVSGATTLVCYK